jgi:hypothetical protein
MTDWTKEEDEAFNEVEKQSNLGKQILQAQGQPYHWETDAIKAAVQIEREECARIADSMDVCQDGSIGEAIRARGNT